MGGFRLPAFNFDGQIPRRFAANRSKILPLRLGLNLKLLLIVASVLLVGVLASTFLVLTLQRQQLIGSTETAVTNLSNAITASLEHAMLSNDRALAGQIVRAIADEGGIARIHIVDSQGIVQVSSEPAEVGGRFNRAQPECQFCHVGGAQPANQTAILTLVDGHEALVNVDVIRNKPQCTACHARQSEILGLLMIEMPLTDLQSQLAAGFLRMALSALVTFALLVVLMALALRRFVARPVRDLVRGVAQISAGNLDYQVQVSSRDELGDLAESFDAMRQKLKASRAEMERRNQELSVLNEVALAASQLLDLQQILDLALEMVVNRLGMQTGTIHLFDEDVGRLTLRACRGMSQEQCQETEGSRQKPGGDLSLSVAQTGEAIFVPDMAVDSRFRERWADPQGRSYVNVPLKSEGKVVGTMGLVTYARQPLTEREVEVLTAVGHEIGIAIDNALLVGQTRRSEHEATTLYELGTQISSSLELGQVLDAVAQGAQHLLATDIGVVGLLDEERQDVSVRAAAGARTEALLGLRISVGEGTLGSALAAGRPIIVEEHLPGLSMPYDAAPIAAEGAISFLGVPLRHGEHLLGLVGAMTRHHRRFSEGDVRLLTRLAHQVAVAIENAQLYEQVRHLVTLKERDWLARELHDGLAQALAFLNVKASLIGEQLSSDQTTQAQASLIEFKRVAQATYTDVREAIFSLHTTASPGLGLLPMLREYLVEYQEHYGLDIRLVVDLDDESLARFSPEVDIQLFRIIQEALSNVRKHAQTNKAWVRFEQDDDSVRIRVEDAGRGFDPTQVTGEGSRYFGLQIMRERAESVGASLDLDSRPGEGTRVVIRLPRSLGGWQA